MSAGLRISFVVPVKNGAAYLERCLASIAASRLPVDQYEVIVGDNGSTDRSADVARTAGAVVCSLPNVNVATVRNQAAAAARAPVLAFVDADHEIDSDWPLVALALLAAPGVVAAGAPYVAPPDGNWVQRAYDSFRSRGRATQDTDWLPSGNLAVTRDAFERAQGFDARLETCEDVDLCQRLRQAGGRIVADPRLRSIHRGDPRSLGAVFRGELWRGRDNLRVSLRSPLTLRSLPSVLIPVLDLLALAAVPFGLLAWSAGGGWVVLAAILLLLLFMILRAAVMLRRRDHVGLTTIAQTFLVAGVYDLARAMALIGRTSHDARRRT